MAGKYSLPPGVAHQVDALVYVRWLGRIADAHKRRDRRRGNAGATRESYMLAIHLAVLETNGTDAYTGQPLRWDLLSQYDNEQSLKGGRDYKARFAMKPTVDHVDNGRGAPAFRICAWQTNSAKSDLPLEEFVDLCRRVVRFHDQDNKP